MTKHHPSGFNYCEKCREMVDLERQLAHQEGRIEVLKELIDKREARLTDK